MITSITRVPHSGAWIVTAVLRDALGEYFDSMTFYGMAKRDAIREYKNIRGI